jgi:hypothetical protein
MAASKPRAAPVPPFTRLGRRASQFGGAPGPRPRSPWCGLFRPRRPQTLPQAARWDWAARRGGVTRLGSAGPVGPPPAEYAKRRKDFAFRPGKQFILLVMARLLARGSVSGRPCGTDQSVHCAVFQAGVLAADSRRGVGQCLSVKSYRFAFRGARGVAAISLPRSSSHIRATPVCKSPNSCPQSSPSRAGSSYGLAAPVEGDLQRRWCSLAASPERPVGAPRFATS